MKKLFAALLLSFPLAASANMMVMKNQKGGVIALVKDVCPVEHDKTTPLYVAIAATDTEKVPGCWYYKDQKVFVFWFTDKGVVESEYPAQNFEYVSSEKKQNKNSI
jgi:hypothetical protein